MKCFYKGGILTNACGVNPAAFTKMGWYIGTLIVKLGWYIGVVGVIAQHNGWRNLM